VPFWELPKLPAGEWVPFLEAMDLVLCPTQFILDAVAASAPLARCEHYAQTVYMPGNVEPDRPAVGLPADATLFLASFDSGSDVERKNPFAAVEAFERAFGDRDDVRLVIKINSGRASRRHTDVLSWGARRLEEVLGPKENAILIDQSLAYRDVLRLYASCDVMVSLHRSEGLGLHLIEAMALAKPVIATRWSGNMDFMDDQDSMLMDYRMVPVVSRHPIYASVSIGEGQTWADPDIAQAADAMTLLADRPDLRRAIGERARADYVRDHEVFRHSAMPEHLREMWLDRTSRVPDHDQRSIDLARLRKMGLYRGLRRRAGRALRAMGLRL
jgi:glycosyltransferase involved in cell wall biosynthesis